MKTITTYLEEFLTQKEPTPLYRRVIKDALSEEDPLYYLKNMDIIRGSVSGLIYYKDTHAFFDQYYDEIQDLVEKYKDNVGEELVPKDDIKNFYAWFAYKAVAKDLLVGFKD